VPTSACASDRSTAVATPAATRISASRAIFAASSAAASRALTSCCASRRSSQESPAVSAPSIRDRSTSDAAARAAHSAARRQSAHRARARVAGAMRPARACAVARPAWQEAEQRCARLRRVPLRSSELGHAESALCAILRALRRGED
jgi:hypothetical protein